MRVKMTTRRVILRELRDKPKLDRAGRSLYRYDAIERDTRAYSPAYCCRLMQLIPRQS